MAKKWKTIDKKVASYTKRLNGTKQTKNTANKRWEKKCKHQVEHHHLKSACSDSKFANSKHYTLHHDLYVVCCHEKIVLVAFVFFWFVVQPMLVGTGTITVNLNTRENFEKFTVTPSNVKFFLRFPYLAYLALKLNDKICWKRVYPRFRIGPFWVMYLFMRRTCIKILVKILENSK